MVAVTRVTGGAGVDDLTEEDYREIYEELRRERTLDQFREMIGSQYSKAWWSKWERRLLEMTRPGRNELRAAVGLPALPATVGEAMAGVDPNAQVWRVGERAPDRVVLVGCDGPVTLHVNGAVVAEEIGQGSTESEPVTVVTGRAVRRVRKGVHLCPELWERLNVARLASGLTWEEFLGRLVEGEE
jgi:hypothetical protein